MAEIFEKVLTEEEKADIKDLVATLLFLPQEDRIILMSNAQALKARCELERMRKTKETA